MGHITGGVVKFERRVKTGEFEHKHAAADIAFSVPEGENAQETIDLAGAQAHGQVHRLLNISNSGPAKTPTDKDKLAAAVVGDAAVEKHKRSTKLPAPADPASMDVVTDQPAGGPQSGGNAVTGTPPEPQSADPAAIDDVLQSAPVEVTDKDLTAHISKHNEKTKNAVEIRKLIGVYTPQDGLKHSAVEIPQEKRSAFLVELAKIAAVPA